MANTFKNNLLCTTHLSHLCSCVVLFVFFPLHHLPGEHRQNIQKCWCWCFNRPEIKLLPFLCLEFFLKNVKKVHFLSFCHPIKRLGSILRLWYYKRDCTFPKFKCCNFPECFARNKTSAISHLQSSIKFYLEKCKCLCIAFKFILCSHKLKKIFRLPSSNLGFIKTIRVFIG